MYRIFHPKTTEYTLFSNAHGMLSRIDHVLCHKTSVNKFKRIEVISSMFSDSTMKLEINYRKKNWKRTKHVENKKHATKKTSGSMKKLKRKSENTSRQMKVETQHPKIYGMQQK